MKNLLVFLLKYHVFFLFLFLELVSVTFIVRYNNFHRVRFLHSSNEISGEIYGDYQSVLEYFSLRKLNDSLAADNAFLRSQLYSVSLADTQSAVLRKIQQELIHSVSAKVINNSVNKQYNYITLNRGADDGIKPDMGVICSDGVVGVIINVSKNYSTALSLLNGRWTVNAKLANSNHFGPLRWEGDNPYVMVLEEIPYHVKVNKNDQVLTSGYSAIFPQGIEIGKVIRVEHQEGESFQKIWVQLFIDLRNIFYVEIIENVTKHEQLNLEKLTSDE
jgi:rod shape-determining protein MreC